MKIAIACCGLGHIKRGIEVWAADLARLLYAKGVNVTLFKGAGRVEAPYEVVVPCITRRSRMGRWLTGVNFKGKWRTPLATPYALESYTFALNLRRQLAHYDIIHFQDPLVGLHVQRYKERNGIKTVTIFADGTEEKAERKHGYDVVQELDEEGVKEMVESGYPGKLFAIPNFVDTERFRPGDRINLRKQYDIPADRFVVLSVGAIEKGFKRIDYLINEFAAHPPEKGLLVIVGAKTDQTDELRSLGRRLLGDRCRIITDLPHEAMPDVYRMADVFVFCVTHGIYGIVTAEAAATGLPCILHNWKRVSWVGGPEAEIIDMTKVNELGRALARLADPVTRLARGKRTRDWAVQTISANVVIDQYIGMYAEVLGKS
jgi:glycosyltransferase involved in cell wall biosynthesis